MKDFARELVLKEAQDNSEMAYSTLPVLTLAGIRYFDMKVSYLRM